MAKQPARRKKQPVGRPTKYKPEYCKLLIDHMAQGLSFECFGAKVDASKETIYTWTEVHPEFLDAKKRGQSIAQEFYEKCGVGGMTGRINGFNTTAWIFNMKNRFKWQDKVDIEQHSTQTHIIVTDDEEEEVFEI